MKNIINYYYGISVNEHKKTSSSFIFYKNNIEYEFIECYEDINNLMQIYSYLKMYGRNLDEIILNKNKEILTHYENKPYILLKKTNSNLRDISLKEIIEYDCLITPKHKPNLKNLWKQKIDYYEIQLSETKTKYPLLNESFSYYLGLSEIAIELLNFVDFKNINYYICHKRIDRNELFNPLNMIIDSKVRDIAEYIKKMILDGEYDSNKIVDFINKEHLNNDEITLFFSRLIYPSYYFDMYEKIFVGIEKEVSINKIIKKNVLYETFLKDLYNYIKIKYNIPQIEFLEY